MEATQPRYLTDSEGHRTDVVLAINEYDKLVEDLHDLTVVAERRDEETLSLDKVEAELKSDGLLLRSSSSVPL